MDIPKTFTLLKGGAAALFCAALLSQAHAADDGAEFHTLNVVDEGVIVRVEFDNGDLNLVDGPMIADLARLAGELTTNEDAKVVVFASANPEFFLARADLALLTRLETVTEPPKGLSPFHRLMEAYRGLPQVTIAEICGITRGAGSEFALALDIRIACDEAVLSQPEIGFGLQPGGGALHRLSENVGRSRAMEIILTGRDFSGEEAADYGWVNWSAPAHELPAASTDLAERMAQWDSAALKRAKRAFNDVAGFDSAPARHAKLQLEFAAFVEAVQSETGQARISRFLADRSDPIERERRLPEHLAQY